MPVRMTGSPTFGFLAAIVFSAVVTIPAPVLAEIQVRGNPEAVTIEARDTSVEEILAALSRAFDMDYQSSIDLDKRLYGTYVGPLSRVLTRILQGYNFVVKTDNGSIAVTVVGTPNAASAATSAPPTLAAAGDPQAPAPAPQQSGGAAPVPQVSGSAATPAPGPRSSRGGPFPAVERPPLAPPRRL
jgi:hypothetical protein